jgi:hypothetical protein
MHRFRCEGSRGASPSTLQWSSSRRGPGKEAAVRAEATRAPRLFGPRSLTRATSDLLSAAANFLPSRWGSSWLAFLAGHRIAKRMGRRRRPDDLRRDDRFAQGQGRC